jgi:hypothetical protein
MSLTKFRRTLLIVPIAALLAPMTLANQGKEEKRPGADDPARKPPSLSGKVVAVAKDGKGLVIEATPASRDEPPAKHAIKLTDKTQLSFSEVGPGGAKLAEGFAAQIWLADGSKDTAARVHLVGKESARKLPDVTGKVMGTSDSGKIITFLTTPKTREEEARPVDVHLTDKTVLLFSYIPRGGAKPDAGYHADVWLVPDSQDTAARVTFSGTAGLPERGAPETKPDHAGRIVGVSKDGKVLTFLLPGGRDEPPEKYDIKIDDKTQTTYLQVGPGGDRPTEGYQARVWLAEGSKDRAAKLVLQGIDPEAQGIVEGKVVGVAKDGQSITLEVRPQERDEPNRREVKITPKTRLVFQGVGPGGAALTDGYQARVWLAEGTKDTAAQVLLFGATGGGGR